MKAAKECVNCGEKVEVPPQLDVPADATLCNHCHEEFVWTCDSCGRNIAYPDIEGGELFGQTPLEGEQWCGACCKERVDQCCECGMDDLIEDMTETEHGRLCERCATWHVPTEDSPVLTKEGWQEVAISAVNDLPSDIRISVGYDINSASEMVITVAVVPIGDEDHLEYAISKIEIRYCDRMGDLGWLPGLDELYSPGGACEEQVAWPVISIEGEAEVVRWSLCPGRASVDALKGHVQLAILETMHSGGGDSLVAKDKKGCFVRDDGTRILNWQ